MTRIASLFTALILAVVALPGLAAAQDKPAVPAYEERVMGKADAPVTILEFSSLTCPHCAEFHKTVLPQVKKDYIDTGKAKLVFTDFPLDPLATAAAMIGRCVPETTYFRFLETLFANQDTWARSQKPLDALTGYARLAGLPPEQVTACLQSQEMLNGINAAKQQAAQQYGVQGTPTLVVNGKVLPAYTDLPAALAEATK